MEEEIKEQPEEEQADVCVTKMESADSDSGSLNEQGEYGKFKTKEDLITAYNNLQAEFTRKCQKLSELEKEKSQEKTLSEAQIDDGLSAFLLKNADAKDYSEEIKEKVKSENVADPFTSAWAKIILERFSSKQKDEPLLNKYVFNDEQLKRRVIESYLSDLSKNKPPILISSDSGEKGAKLDPIAPKSLNEAKKLVEDMFS